MEQPSAKEDLLDWYVNKLYKKAVDHCLQQEKTTVPVLGQGQGHKGHYQGHHESIDKKQVCKSSLNGGLSKCTRTSSKNPQSSVNMYRSDIDDEGFNSEKHFHENTDKFVKQPTSYSRHAMNIVLSERRNTLNTKLHQDSLKRNITPPMNTSDGPYRQTDCQKDERCKNGRFSKPTVSYVTAHQPHSQRPVITDCKRNGSSDIQENEFPIQKQGQKDWISHSVLPHRTNLSVNQQSFSKDDSDLCQRDERNIKAYSEHSVRIARGSNGAIPCQSVQSVSKEKRCLDSVSPKWESKKLETEKKCLVGERTQWESMKMDRRWSERTCPRDYLVNTHVQFHLPAVSKDRSVMKNSLETRGAQNSKAASLLISKSYNHCSSSDAKKESNMVNLNSEDRCNNRAHPSADVLDEESNLLVPHEKTKTYSEPEPLPGQSPIDDNGLKSPETDDKTEIHSTENKTSKSPLASQISLSTVEPVENPVHPNRCTVSTATVAESEVLPLTGENLKQFNKATSQERGDNSLPGLDNGAYDEGAESDSGGSCKSGIVIKPGHITQKRKRSHNLQDESSCKRRSSEANNDKSTDSLNFGKCVNNPVNGSRTTVNKNKPKSAKSEKGGKYVEAAKVKVKTKRDTKHVYKKVKDQDSSKKKAKTNNLSLKTFDVSKKRIQQKMSESVKRCVEREISILQAHEDQAMSTNSESCGNLSKSDRMSSLAFLDLKDLAQVPEPGKSFEHQSVYMSKKHVGGVWQSIVKK